MYIYKIQEKFKYSHINLYKYANFKTFSLLFILLVGTLFLVTSICFMLYFSSISIFYLFLIRMIFHCACSSILVYVWMSLYFYIVTIKHIKYKL